MKKTYENCRTIIKDKSVSFCDMWDYVYDYYSDKSNSKRLNVLVKVLWYRIFRLGKSIYANSLYNSISSSKERKFPGSKRMFNAWKKSEPGFYPTESLKVFSDKEVLPQILTKVDIIIPVYNGIEHLEKLIPLLFSNTTAPHMFIFVNDCSPDPNTKDYISSMIADREDCILIDNKENVGFTQTVNNGAKYSDGDFLVLLNTDVMVPPYWLERLIAPMLVDETIGTTTPFTNGGVFYSYPNFGDNHRIDNPDEFIEIDKRFRRIGLRTDDDLEFVNGVGFCMAIRKKCWNIYGGLDVKAFGKGYGEECDLCMRFLKNGYRNVLVPNLYVYHNHGGSFNPEEKKSLVKAHYKILQRRWAGYLDLIQPFVHFDPWAKFRLAVQEESFAHNTDCLFIDLDGEEGGACKFRVQQEKKFLNEGKKVVSLLYTRGTESKWKLSFINQDGRSEFQLKDFEQVEKWVTYFSPKEIFVNNFAFCTDIDYLLSFFSGAFSYRWHSLYREEASPMDLKKAKEYSFPISFENSKVCRLSLLFGTYNRKNTGVIKVKLTDCKSTILLSDEIEVSSIRDNCPYSLFYDSNSNIDFSLVKDIHLMYMSQNEDDQMAVYVSNDNTPIFTYSSSDNNSEHPVEKCVKLTYCYHDFISCCPSFFLMNKKDTFCQFKDCGVECLKDNHNRLYQYTDISFWQRGWKLFLPKCTEYRFFSENTFRLASHFHDYDKNRVNIHGHDSLVTFKSKFQIPPKSSALKIGVIGSWYPSKGSKKVVELSYYLKSKEPDAQICFYGICDEKEQRSLEQTNPNIKWMGRYNISDLPETLSKDNISVIFFASVYPETYSFVIRECMDIEAPIVCFPLGASGDRVKDYDKGFLTKDFTIEAVYEKIKEATQISRSKI